MTNPQIYAGKVRLISASGAWDQQVSSRAERVEGGGGVLPGSPPRTAKLLSCGLSWKHLNLLSRRGRGEDVPFITETNVSHDDDLAAHLEIKVHQLQSLPPDPGPTLAVSSGLHLPQPLPR